MCGIAGFSLSERSTVNARELAHNLLSEIQWRGNMASGFAFSDDKGKIGYYKAAVTGGQLPLKGLPRSAKTVILHTRLTTHGSEHVNENNHPVISPDNKIALTHNGVIWNEQEVRHDALIGVKLPEVDTSVIGALIQYYGLEGVGELSGDAAIAWLESGKADELNVARLESSPLAYTWLLDGSFVYASTPVLLMNALDAAQLEFGAVFVMDERVYFKVINGIIREFERTPELKAYNYDWRYSYNRKAELRELTEGGHKPKTEVKTGKSFMNHYDPNTGEWGYVELTDDYSDFDLPDAEEIKAIEASDRAMALMDSDGFIPGSGSAAYYTVDSDGDYETYETLEKLENELKWWAALRAGDDQYGAEGEVRWIEHFVDIGSFELDGSTETSWVDDPAEIYLHERADSDGLGYIREGIGYLQRALGA